MQQRTQCPRRGGRVPKLFGAHVEVDIKFAALEFWASVAHPFLLHSLFWKFGIEFRGAAVRQVKTASIAKFLPSSTCSLPSFLIQPRKMASKENAADAAAAAEVPKEETAEEKAAREKKEAERRAKEEMGRQIAAQKKAGKGAEKCAHLVVRSDRRYSGFRSAVAYSTREWFYALFTSHAHMSITRPRDRSTLHREGKRQGGRRRRPRCRQGCGEGRAQG
jgi:hypothetical protein